MTNFSAADAAHLLHGLDATARRARTRAWSAWFPLAVFGLLVAGSSWWYRDPGAYWGRPIEEAGMVSLSDGLAHTAWGRFSGGTYPRPEAAIYWMIALPLGYALCAAWYARRTAGTGVAPPWRDYVLAGAGFGAVLALTLLVDVPPPHTQPAVWGVANPFVAVALGFVVLAVRSRTRALLGFSVAYAFAAAAVGMSSLSQLGDTTAAGSPFLQVLALSLPPLMAAAVLRLRDGRQA